MAKRKNQADAAKPAEPKTATYGDEYQDAPPAGRAKAGRSRSEFGADGERILTARQRSTTRAAERDDRALLTLIVKPETDDEFDVLLDDSVYWGGSEPPFTFEIKLSPGVHLLRLRQRHAINRRPRRYMPLPFALLFGDGERGEMGPYRAVMEAEVSAETDGKLTIGFERIPPHEGEKARYRFKPSAGKGVICDVTDTSMSSTPRLRRSWLRQNCAALIAMTAMSLAIVGFGAYTAVQHGGSVGGGILLTLIGTAMSAGCAVLISRVRDALDGEYAPDVDFPQPKKSGGRRTGSGDEGETDSKPAKKRRGRSGRKNSDDDYQYEGAYDGVREMSHFEASDIATATLNSDEIESEKDRLLRELNEDS